MAKALLLLLLALPAHCRAVESSELYERSFHEARVGAQGVLVLVATTGHADAAAAAATACAAVPGTGASCVANLAAQLRAAQTDPPFAAAAQARFRADRPAPPPAPAPRTHLEIVHPRDGSSVAVQADTLELRLAVHARGFVSPRDGVVCFAVYVRAPRPPRVAAAPRRSL